LDVFSQCPHKTKLAQAILQDWKNWDNEVQAKNDRNLCDPVALYLYLHPDHIGSKVSVLTEFPCLNENGQVREEFIGIAYNAKNMKTKITDFQEGESNVIFIRKLYRPQVLRRKIIYKIARLFYPGVIE
jgi:hypothetical protein